MIRINLFGEKRDNTPFYIFQGVILGLCVLLTLGVCIGIQAKVSTELSRQEEEKNRLEQRLNKLKQKTKKVDELEAKKKLLAEKLNTIASLKVKKQGPVHLMDELTKTIPVRAWVTSLSQRDESIEISGAAVDPQTVSEFMRKVEDSLYFGNVELVYSRGENQDGVKLQAFSISAKLTNAGDLQKLLQERDKAHGAPAGEQKAPQPS